MLTVVHKFKMSGANMNNRYKNKLGEARGDIVLIVKIKALIANKKQLEITMNEQNHLK